MRTLQAAGYGRAGFSPRGSRGELAQAQAQGGCRARRWQFALFMWVGLTLWWLSLHQLELHWHHSGPLGHPLDNGGQGLDRALEEQWQRRSLLDAAARAGAPLYQPGSQLGVCVMSADFWGSPTAGGTATAYHLLAQALSGDPGLRVTFLGATRRVADCEAGARLSAASGHNVSFRCLESRHFLPEVVETEPYEQMSHALVAWTRENIAACDVIHGHEWGGLFTDLATLDNYRQLKPGLRLAIEAHGGHFWSTQGQVQRPLDVTSLRIDHGERMTLQLASALISPTHYMTAFLAQRGWRLPEESIVIPNVVPAAEAASGAGERKPVWRLAFFSRLEERKGIKLFVAAVEQLLARRATLPDKFEVYFVGAESIIDMRSSGEWLQAKTQQWPFPTHIKVNAPRTEALNILAEEGMLLVQCSLIDNMPYVVAEAAAKGIPLLVFDVGGVLEMLDPEVNRESVVWEPTTDALYAQLHRTLVRGDLKSAVLSQAVTSGQEQWLDWHAQFAGSSVRRLQQEDTLLAGQAAGRSLGSLLVQRVPAGASSLEVWNAACRPRGAPDAPLLLLPEQYELLNASAAADTMVELLQMGMLRRNGVGALAFGTQVLRDRVAFPSGPTWMGYSGDEARCNDDVPVLLRRSVFCSAYLAEARVFRTYHSWVLSMLLGQAGWRMHTYPEVLFRATNFTTRGHQCMADKAPAERGLDFNRASNLYGDAEEVMVNLHLAPFPKPASSIVEDYPTEQSHKGWQIGYLGGQDPGLKLLKYWLPEGADKRDGRWACAPGDDAYPAMQHSLLHPCAGGGGACCGLDAAPIVTRFASYFASRQAMLLMAYEVWPICGDGLDMEVSLTSTGPNGRFRHIFLRQGFEAGQRDAPQRQKVEFRFELHVGDWVDLVVWPRGSHDCDGIYLVDMQLWESDGMAAPAERGRPPPAEEAEPDSKLQAAAVSHITASDGKQFAAAGKARAGEGGSTRAGDSGSGGEATRGVESFRARRLQAEQAGQLELAEEAAAGLPSPLRSRAVSEQAPRGRTDLSGGSGQGRHGSWARSLWQP